MKNKCIILCGLLAVAAGGTFTGCAGDQYQRSTGQYIDDKSLGVRVHDALSGNSDYKFNDVNVSVFRGTVQLSGFVNKSDQKSMAGDLVRSVQGVRDVQNNITVKD